MHIELVLSNALLRPPAHMQLRIWIQKKLCEFWHIMQSCLIFVKVQEKSFFFVYRFGAGFFSQPVVVRRQITVESQNKYNKNVALSWNTFYLWIFSETDVPDERKKNPKILLWHMCFLKWKKQSCKLNGFLLTHFVLLFYYRLCSRVSIPMCVHSWYTANGSISTTQKNSILSEFRVNQIWCRLQREQHRRKPNRLNDAARYCVYLSFVYRQHKLSASISNAMKINAVNNEFFVWTRMHGGNYWA